MSDLFHESVPASFIAEVAGVMARAQHHVFQVLTKRDDRMMNLLNGELRWLGDIPHVWLGVSVEDRQFGVPRIKSLRRTPAGLRFLSIEPLLEDLGPIDLRGIGWVIVGGESGYGARRIDPAWARNVRDQCNRAGIPFFFKQWGGVQKKKNGRLLDGRTWDEFPNSPWRSGGAGTA